MKKNIKDIHTITIVGVGLIGGALAISLKERCNIPRIIGVGRSHASLEKFDNIVDSNGNRVIDEKYIDVYAGVKDADIVILAVPVLSIIDIGKQIANSISSGCIVTDVGSTKAMIVQELTSVLRNSGYFVGTHPLAGSHKSGPEAAKANMFNNAVCVVTPIKDTNPDALEIIKKLWINIGANVVEMTPEVHDKLIAVTSHLPHIIVASLVNIAAEYGDDIIPLISSGFKDTTRIAQAHEGMWRDICLTNKQFLLEIIDKFKNILDKWQMVIDKEDKDNIEEMFRVTRKWRIDKVV
jgi:prephenate dehydrogenase